MFTRGRKVLVITSRRFIRVAQKLKIIVYIKRAFVMKDDVLDSIRGVCIYITSKLNITLITIMKFKLRTKLDNFRTGEL